MASNVGPDGMFLPRPLEAGEPAREEVAAAARDAPVQSFEEVFGRRADAAPEQSDAESSSSYSLEEDEHVSSGSRSAAASPW